MPTPIVLLDEEQQRTLQQAQAQAQASDLTASRADLGAMSQRYDVFAGVTVNTTIANARQGSFGGASADLSMTPASETQVGGLEPRTDFTTPRTNFTSAEPRTNFTSGAEPRTNFTSAAVLARQNERLLYDHIGATGTRTTDLSGRSNGTYNSSPKTNFTNRKFGGGPEYDHNYGDSTPPLLSDRISDTLESDEKTGGEYIGSSSGLKLSIKYILIGVILGVGLGVLFGSMKVSALTAKWISLPGDLFLRALQSLVVPYVFCSVAVAIGDIVFVGKVSIVGLQTFKVFVIMWISACTFGMGMALLFRPMFRLDRQYISTPTNALGFTCANGMMLQTLPDSSVMCSANATAIGGVIGKAAFEVEDVNNVFSKNVKRALALMSVSDQILAMLNLIVPKNIFTSLSNGDLLSTITFGMVLGAIAGRNYFTKTRRVNYLYLVLLQLRNTFFLAMEWVTWLTPGAVISIIAGSFAANQDSLSQLKDVYMYVIAAFCAASVQVLFVQPLVIFLMTRCNPYHHMAHMIQAYVFAFGVASSVSTAPITLACVKKARVCSQSLANFVISIGVCSNMSGAGFYYPVAIVFLAESSGNGDELTPLRLLAIYLLSILACAGTPPVPSAGVVLMASIYKTVFGVSEVPSTFALYLAVDFLVDRISTVCNVNDDIMALKVIAENTDETIVGDHLGERE